MSNLVLAYLGDAVYELYIRKYLIEADFSKVGELQKESLKFVSATSQRQILERLESAGVFTAAEIVIINRGRNASSHKSKNTDIITYKKATGLECLIGHLYLHDKDRLDEIMEMVVGE